MKLGDWEEPRLPFPTRTVQCGNATVEEYIIPEERKAEVLEQLYPFVGVPSLDERLYDLHEDATFVVRDFRVKREHGMNMLVSPYYFESESSLNAAVPVRGGRDGYQLLAVSR